MKANAPEKIWINSPQDLPCSSVNSNSIEYIRKDVFIEKACKYFRRCLEDTKVIDDYRNILVRGIQASYTSVEEFNDDFRKYMKGE